MICLELEDDLSIVSHFLFFHTGGEWGGGYGHLAFNPQLLDNDTTFLFIEKMSESMRVSCGNAHVQFRMLIYTVGFIPAPTPAPLRIGVHACMNNIKYEYIFFLFCLMLFRMKSCA